MIQTWLYGYKHDSFINYQKQIINNIGVIINNNNKNNK